ncbi:MAG: RNA polymerase sigma factor [Flavobacteriales bacterium]
MKQDKTIDHLFRHQFGKMVSILTRIFGLSNLETIEDAVQDTFIKASIAWRDEMPENPEAWLTKVAKNRTLDLFKSIKAEKNRAQFSFNGPSSIAVSELFLDNEIEDAQLRMIFTACHETLDPRDQISFALKTISGFSNKEIASALLLKEETVKKRLHRARKSIKDNKVKFEIPVGKELNLRLDRVLEVIYLIFNEGFHSGNPELLVRMDLCGEALRLCKLLIGRTETKTSKSLALFALICFHSARLDSKTNDLQEAIAIKDQDRSKWLFPLIVMGNRAMNLAVEGGEFSVYHFEAAIVCEHLKAKRFEDTNWKAILGFYKQLQQLDPSPIHQLNIVVVLLQLKETAAAKKQLQTISPKDLERREYLYHGCLAEILAEKGQMDDAIAACTIAIELANNKTEKSFLQKRRAILMDQL